MVLLTVTPLFVSFHPSSLKVYNFASAEDKITWTTSFEYFCYNTMAFSNFPTNLVLQIFFRLIFSIWKFCWRKIFLYGTKHFPSFLHLSVHWKVIGTVIHSVVKPSHLLRLLCKGFPVKNHWGGMQLNLFRGSTNRELEVW